MDEGINIELAKISSNIENMDRRMMDHKKHSDTRMDRLMKLLTPRIEKWDATSTKVDTMHKVFIAVIMVIIGGGAKLIFFK